MILTIPVVDGHELTKACLSHLAATNMPKDITVVIFDNKSDVPYSVKDFTDYPFKVDVIRSEDNNLGYYYPLLEIYQQYDDELIGLMHNDLIIYQPDWVDQIEYYFDADPLLGLIGTCGSNEIDGAGGRGGGTMVNFRGGSIQVGDQVWHGQDQSAGLRVNGLHPAVCLDSLFMMFRRDVVPHLKIDSDITLAHFYDRIWPIRTIEANYKVAVLGIDQDHIGGMTTTANMRYRNDCQQWLDDRNLGFDPRNTTSDPETEMYLIAENRYLGEYRELKRFLPCRIGPDYAIQR